MNLSYFLRLLCLVIVVAGAVHAGLQVSLAACRRPIMRLLTTASARGRERILYLLQLAPLLAALLFTGALCVPQYLRLEPADGSEAVSAVTLLLAAAVIVWFGFFATRGVVVCGRTLRFTRACKDAAETCETHRGLPVLALHNSTRVIALVGLLRPSILVSRDILTGQVLDPASLSLALDHERSHALHRDNWKLLSLQLLPRLGHNRWFKAWQTAAEWAADDDAARGDSARRLLLAESLVRVARSARDSRPSALPVLHTAFSCRDEELAERVERLVRMPAARRRPQRFLILTVSAFGLTLVAIAAALSPWIYTLSERLLHLG